MGIGEATFGIFAPAVLADFYPERDRNRILSIFYVAIPVGAALGYLAGGQIGSRWGWRAPFFVCALPGFLVAALYGWMGREPERGASDHIQPTLNRATVLGIFRNPAFLTATFGLAMLTFAMGGISWWMPEFLRRLAGMSMGNASLTVGAITVVDGIAGTLVGGWIAQLWLRTNHRALYLLSAWSVALTLPCGALVFFGPHSWAIPSLFAAEFFLFLNTGPLNTAIVNSVSGAGSRHRHLHQPLLHSLLRRHLFAADHRRHQRPLEPQHRPGRNTGFAGVCLRNLVVRSPLRPALSRTAE